MISIIIPTLNETKTIGPCLFRLMAQTEPHEIVVVDGSSHDETLNIVNKFPGIKKISCRKRGRGIQMNQGVAATTGKHLLFLHADTFLPLDGLKIIKTLLAQANTTAGSFSLRFDHPHPLLVLYGRLSRINHILFTYGDQGLFMKRKVFESIGGFTEIPLMEDVDIQKRLRKVGRFVKVKTPVTTSARRFLSKGIIRQQLLNIGLVLLYHAGVSPEKLERYYQWDII